MHRQDAVHVVHSMRHKGPEVRLVAIQRRELFASTSDPVVRMHQLDDFFRCIKHTSHFRLALVTRIAQTAAKCLAYFADRRSESVLPRHARGPAPWAGGDLLEGGGAAASGSRMMACDIAPAIPLDPGPLSETGPARAAGWGILSLCFTTPFRHSRARTLRTPVEHCAAAWPCVAQHHEWPAGRWRRAPRMPP